MAAPSWTGGALAVTQAGTITVLTYDAGTTYILTIGAKSVSAIAAGGVNQTATALVAAWNAMAAPNYEFLDAVTSSTGSSGVITFTGANAGVPFTVTSSVSGGTGTIGAYASTTAATGPNFWDNVGNWTTGTVPTTDDSVTIDGGPSILYNINQSGVTLASLLVTENYPSSSQIGLTAQTSPTNPSAGYAQYRPQRLKLGATSCNIATRSNLIRLDLTPAVTTVIVSDSGSPLVTGGNAIDLFVNSASDSVNVLKGFVGVNAAPGDSGSLGTLNVSYVNNPPSDANVQCGAALTLTTLNCTGGTIVLQNGCTTINNRGAVINYSGGNITTVNNDIGTINHSGTGTVTTLNNAANWNRLGMLLATITTLNLYAGSQGGDENATYTYTNPTNYKQSRAPAGPQDQASDVAYWTFGTNQSVSL